MKETTVPLGAVSVVLVCDYHLLICSELQSNLNSFFIFEAADLIIWRTKAHTHTHRRLLTHRHFELPAGGVVDLNKILISICSICSSSTPDCLFACSGTAPLWFVGVLEFSVQPAIICSIGKLLSLFIRQHTQTLLVLTLRLLVPTGSNLLLGSSSSRCSGNTVVISFLSGHHHSCKRQS